MKCSSFKNLFRKSKFISFSKIGYLNVIQLSSERDTYVFIGVKREILISSSKIHLKKKSIFFKCENPFQLKLSNAITKTIDSDSIWKLLKVKESVNGRILNAVKGGYSVGIAGLIAFLPQSQILPTKNPDSFFGPLKTFSLFKVDQPNNNIIISRTDCIKKWITLFANIEMTPFFQKEYRHKKQLKKRNFLSLGG